MPNPLTNSWSLMMNLVDRIEHLLADAEAEQKPLEVSPYREQLFELFVTAHGAGFLDENAEQDLTADALCHELAQRWGLDEAARHSVLEQEKLHPEHLARMRMLWSLMRMWMEWTYAWERWPEFHGGSNE
jgi:hypothetical protein